MNSITVNQKINKLEMQIKMLQASVTWRPDFDLEEKLWKNIKPVLKKSRAEVFKEIYA